MYTLKLQISSDECLWKGKSNLDTARRISLPRNVHSFCFGNHVIYSFLGKKNYVCVAMVFVRHVCHIYYMVVFLKLHDLKMREELRGEWSWRGPTRNEVDYLNSSQSKSPVFLRTQADTFCLCAGTCINGIPVGNVIAMDWTTFSLIPS